MHEVSDDVICDLKRHEGHSSGPNMRHCNLPEWNANMILSQPLNGRVANAAMLGKKQINKHKCQFLGLPPQPAVAVHQMMSQVARTCVALVALLTLDGELHACHGWAQKLIKLAVKAHVQLSLRDLCCLRCGQGIEIRTSPLDNVAAQAFHRGMDRPAMGAGGLGVDAVSGNVKRDASKLVHPMQVVSQLTRISEN